RKFTQMFASGLPVIVTPFKLPRGPGGRAPGRRPFDAPGPPPLGDGTPPPPRRIPEREPPQRPPGPDRFRDEIVMQVAAPIRDLEGDVRGALTLVIDPDTEFTRILSVASSGDSGETFAFDPEGVMISRSRFDPQLRQLGLIENQTNSTSALSLSLRDPGGDLTAGF